MLDLRTGKEMTRRETIKGGLGLAAILAAGKAPAYLLGARGVAFGVKEDTNPYQTEDNALSAMWDAEWNVAYKQHANNGQIANLCDPSAPFVINSKGTLNAKYLAFNGLSATCSRNDFAWGTCECAFRIDSGRIVFYGCRKYQTADSSSDFYCLYQTSKEIGSGFEMCHKNNENADYIISGGYYGNNYTASRIYNGYVYKNSILYSSFSTKNSWGNQSVITIGGRVSTTSYDGVGRFYCLRLYNRALTQAEILRNYRLDNDRFYT